MKPTEQEKKISSLAHELNIPYSTVERAIKYGYSEEEIREDHTPKKRKKRKK